MYITSSTPFLRRYSANRLLSPPSQNTPPLNRETPDAVSLTATQKNRPHFGTNVSTSVYKTFEKAVKSHNQKND
jgi:hypothetical protein